MVESDNSDEFFDALDEEFPTGQMQIDVQHSTTPPVQDAMNTIGFMEETKESAEQVDFGDDFFFIKGSPQEEKQK